MRTVDAVIISRAIGRSVERVRRMMDTGEIPTIRLADGSNTYRVTLETWRAWLQQHESGKVPA